MAKTPKKPPPQTSTGETSSTPPWRVEGLPEAGDETGPARPEAGSSQPPTRRRAGPAAVFLPLLVLFLTIGIGLMIVNHNSGKIGTIPYSVFAAEVDDGNVATVYSQGQQIQGEFREPVPFSEDPTDDDPPQFEKFETVRPVWATDDLFAQLSSQQVEITAEPIYEPPAWWVSLLLATLPLVLFVGLWFLLMGRMQGRAMGQMKKKVEPVAAGANRVTFADVAGIDEAKAELSEVVDFLSDPGKYRALGAAIPKGVLLAGSPGTGKTLMARAVAGEANVPFFSASAAEFIEMIVGVGASRVRDLFAEAKKVAPAIIFIDEIDAIGRARGGGGVPGGGHDEREQTLNQILTEMDGFTGSEGVIVVAATNRLDVLDPALLRPGRFDRTVVVGAPDQIGRLQILKVHTRSVPLAADVDLAAFAKATPGMVGAELRNLVNEAALLAARRGHEVVSAADFADALEKITLGAERQILMPPEERERTAYHESGHALLGMLQEGADPVRKISIIPRGRALGVTLSTPEFDRYSYDEAYLRGRIIGALGGMAAEDVVYGNPTTGAESDLEQVSRIARGMVGRWGMSPAVGPVSVLPGEEMLAGSADGPSQATLELVDSEVRRIVEDCYAQACQILRDNRHRLNQLAEELLEHETLDEAQAYRAAGVPRAGATAGEDAPLPVAEREPETVGRVGGTAP